MQQIYEKTIVNGEVVINVEGWTATPNNCTWSNSYESFNYSQWYQDGDGTVTASDIIIVYNILLGN